VDLSWISPVGGGHGERTARTGEEESVCRNPLCVPISRNALLGADSPLFDEVSVNFKADPEKGIEGLIAVVDGRHSYPPWRGPSLAEWQEEVYGSNGQFRVSDEEIQAAHDDIVDAEIVPDPPPTKTVARRVRTRVPKPQAKVS